MGTTYAVGAAGATLISRASERQFVARPAAVQTPFPGLSYGLGVADRATGRVQDPYVNNYGGVMAYDGNPVALP